MATTTPNYGWDVPTSTDYVKDGAVAIETLGDDIDSSLFSITNGKNMGFVPVSTTTFTSSASISVDNVFTSAYENYMFIFSCSSVSGAGPAVNMKMRAGGTTTTTSIYNGQISQRYTNGNTWTLYAHANVSTMEIGNLDTGGGTCVVQIAKPQATALMTLATQSISTNTTVTSGQIYASNAYGMSVTTAYDGFNIVASGGQTMTGTLRIYGLRNS